MVSRVDLQIFLGRDSIQEAISVAHANDAAKTIEQTTTPATTGRRLNLRDVVVPQTLESGVMSSGAGSLLV